MKSPFLLITLSLTLTLLTACNRTSSADDAAAAPRRTAVTLTHPVSGSIADDVTLTATTAYLKKYVVTAPVAGYIVTARVEPGQSVRAGQGIFSLETMENRTLQTGQTVPVTAGRGGIVLDVTGQPGGYVTEGGPLCTVAETGSLVFELNVPYEQHALARPGVRCTIELPDGSRYPATLGTTLGTMDIASQSAHVVARARTGFLPEGMNAKAIFHRGGTPAPGKWVLPKSAVQRDETLTSSWVMVLTRGNVARRVPVTLGRSDADRVEVISTALRPSDSVILTGGYGLVEGDTVVVTK